MKRYDRLIFVSNDDTCRGPMAETVMQSKFLLEDLEIESRGLVVLFPEPVNQKAEAVMVSHGLTMKEHMARALTAEDLTERTLVLTVEESVKEKILRDHEGVVNVHTLSEYISADGDISNPLGGTLPDYGACYEMIEKMITALVVVLNEEELLC